jgi:hypothetical protein
VVPDDLNAGDVSRSRQDILDPFVGTHEEIAA